MAAQGRPGFLLLIVLDCLTCTLGLHLHKAGEPAANITAWLDTVTREPKHSKAAPKAATSRVSKAIKEMEGSANLTDAASQAFYDERVEESQRNVSGVFSDLKSSADTLKTQIQEAEALIMGQLQEHEQALKATLEEKRANISLLERRNEDLRKDNDHLRTITDELFQRAKQLKLEGKVWSENWREMEENITLVMQVTKKTLDEMEDSFNESEMNVIDELNAKAKRDEALSYRDDLLRKVSGSALSLAEVERPRVKAAVMQVLSQQLSEVAKAKNEEMKRLDDSYKQAMDQEAAREKIILADQAELIKAKKSFQEVQAKLQEAVGQLEDLKEANEKRGSLIRAYLSEMGKTPVPTDGETKSWDDLLRTEAAQRDRLAKMA